LPEAWNKWWSAFFIGIVLVVPSAVVSALVGAQSGLVFWMMGFAVYEPVRSAPNLSFGRRLAIWLTALTVGGITVRLGMIAIELLTLFVSRNALVTASGRVTNAFELVVAIRMALRWAPVPVAWIVSVILVRRSSRRMQFRPPSAAARLRIEDLNTQMTVTAEGVHGVSQIQRYGASAENLCAGATRGTTHERRVQKGDAAARKHVWSIAFFAVAVVAVVLVAFFGKSFAEHRQHGESQASSDTLPTDWDEVLRLADGGQARVAPVAVLSIDALLAAYRENEFTAAGNYENAEPRRLPCLLGANECRVVEVTGTIREMGRDGLGAAYLRLATVNEFVSVEARFGKAEHESLRSLHRGQRVSIRCMVLYDTTTYGASAGLLLTRCGVAI
jgi:hypothetical protein